MNSLPVWVEEALSRRLAEVEAGRDQTKEFRQTAVRFKELFYAYHASIPELR